MVSEIELSPTPCIFRVHLEMTLFGNRALASTTCIFACNFVLPLKISVSKSCYRLDAVHILDSSWALLGLSWAISDSLGALLSSIGPVLVCGGAILGQDELFENRVLASTPCTFWFIGK